MHAYVSQFAAEQAAKPGLFEALGINWMLLILQAAAFLLLIAALAKYVMPTLIKSIDERQATIERGLKEAQQSRQALTEAESQVEQLLVKARTEADAIVARSQAEASSLIAEAEDKAKGRAERIVADARAQLDIDIAKARTALRKDTAQLVALATERIIREKVDAGKDAALIDSAINERAGR